MTLLSYARNFVDVTLRGAVKSFDRGFSVGLGAAHPDADFAARRASPRGGALIVAARP